MGVGCRAFWRMAWALALVACGGDDAGSPAIESDAAIDASALDGNLRDAAARDARVGEDAPPPRINECNDPTLQRLPCCWEASNAGRSDKEWAIRSVDIAEPIGIASDVIRTILQDGLDDGDRGETDVVWLVRWIGERRTIETGFGCRDGYRFPFRFSNRGRGCAGDRPEWAPIELAGSIASDTLSSESAQDVLVVPLPDAGDPPPELRIRELRLVHATLTDDTTCVGARENTRRWTYGEPRSEAAGFLTVADTQSQLLGAAGGLSLCRFIAGVDCLGDERAWPRPPNARCDDTRCTDECDVATEPPGTCNAWRFAAGFAAAGVEIE